MTVATYFSDVMTDLTGNTSGQVQTLEQSNKFGGRIRGYVASLTLNSQASASMVAMARIPLFSTLVGIMEITDTSLSTASISHGDTNSATLYSPAHALTSTNTPTWVGAAATQGVPITTGYDCQSGAAVSYAAPSASGGAMYEDIILNVTVAALPASGTYRAIYHVLGPD